MNEQQWLACEDPAVMRDLLQAKSLEAEAELRSWIKACREAHGLPAIATGWVPLEDSEDVKNSAESWCSINRYMSLSPTTRCSLIREIWGNPFRPTLCNDGEGGSGVYPPHYDDCECLRPRLPWLATPKVIAMAQLIHDTQDWGLMPIFADLLEDAGCDNEDVLRHARNEERCPGCCGAGKVKADPYTDDWDTSYYCEHCGRECSSQGHWNHISETFECDIPECEECSGTGWISARAPHVRGCWLLDLILPDSP